MVSSNPRLDLPGLKKLAKLTWEMRHNLLKFYRPYPKQKQFHAMGAKKRFRLLSAGNQYGKTQAGGAETAYHQTGRYPTGWTGRRFEQPILGWGGCEDKVLTRDVMQRKLFGPPDAIGTGLIPADCIIKTNAMRGVTDAFESVRVRHISGGASEFFFKSYEQGRKAWQGMPVDWIWMDEEPPLDIWGEGLARVTKTGGSIALTFTPLKGLSQVVRGYWPHPNSPEKGMVRMELEDTMHEDGTSHISPDERALIVDRYEPHERDARLKGIPVLGSGLIYAVQEAKIGLVEPVMAGPFWRHIGGIDLGGGSSPTAFSGCALNPDNDTFYLLSCYCETSPLIALHASAIRSMWGTRPISWPADAHQKLKTGDGSTIANQYRKHSLNMLPIHAQFSKGECPDGNVVSVEAGIAEILNRMIEGRFKVPYFMEDFWAELRTYHRIKGLINKEHDHVLDSIRYALMMLRFAQTLREHRVAKKDFFDHDPFAERRPRNRGKGDVIVTAGGRLH